MDPAIGKWVRTCLGMEIAPYESGNTMRLDVMLEGLAPESGALARKRHSAGADAQLHVILYRALVRIRCSSTPSEHENLMPPSPSGQ